MLGHLPITQILFSDDPPKSVEGITGRCGILF